MAEEYLGLRITEQRLLLCDYVYNPSTKHHTVKDFFDIKYDFNYKGVNIKECADAIKTELINRDIKTKKIKVVTSTHDISIRSFTSIKQKTYMENVKVLDALAKKQLTFNDKTDTSLGYTVTDSFTTEVEEKKGKLKKVENINTVAYITPTEVLKVIEDLCTALNKELVSITFAGNGVYNYYKQHYSTNETSLLIHISDEYTTISCTKNGILKQQKIDNFGYSGIQGILSMYKASLKFATDSIDSTIRAIKTMNLYTVEEEDLTKMKTLNSIEIEQILEAKDTLINYTIDFLDRLKIIRNDARKNDVKIDKIFIYQDVQDFPDLKYTFEDYLGLPTETISFVEGITGYDKLDYKDYLISILGNDYNTIHLDNSFLEKQQRTQLENRILYGIVTASFVISLAIVGHFVGHYLKESDRNTKLNAQLLEAKEAQEVYQQYVSVFNAYTTLIDFDDSTKNDLSDIDKQLKEIANIMPTNKLIIESISATAGTETTGGQITLSVAADSKDTFAKFLIELGKLDYFESIDQNSITDNLGEGSELFANGREVRGTIVCNYPTPEVLTPVLEETQTDESMTDESMTDDMSMEELPEY